MSSANRESFTSFPIWIPVISFPALIAEAKTSKTMLHYVSSRTPYIRGWPTEESVKDGT